MALKRTLTVTVAGQTFTRKTARDYRFAVVCKPNRELAIKRAELMAAAQARGENRDEQQAREQARAYMAAQNFDAFGVWAWTTIREYAEQYAADARRARNVDVQIIEVH